MSEDSSFPHPFVWSEILASDRQLSGLGLEGAVGEDAPDRWFATGSAEDRRGRVEAAWRRWAERDVEATPGLGQLWARQKAKTWSFVEHAKCAAPRLRKDGDGTLTCLDVLLEEKSPARTVDRDCAGRFGIAPGTSTGGTASHLPVHQPPSHRFLSISVPGDCFYCGVHSRRRWFLSDNQKGCAKDAERAMCSSWAGISHAERSMLQKARRSDAIQETFLELGATVASVAKKWNRSENTIRQATGIPGLAAHRRDFQMYVGWILSQDGYTVGEAADRVGVSKRSLQDFRKGVAHGEGKDVSRLYMAHNKLTMMEASAGPEVAWYVIEWAVSLGEAA